MGGNFALNGQLPAMPLVVILEMHYQSMKNYNYLMVDPSTRKAVIVDPAWQMEKIDAALERQGATLEGVLITHTHPDHIHLAKPVAAKYNCPIWMSHEEIADSGFDAKQLVAIDSTPWFIGDMTIRPIPTPGHTRGGLCYLIGDGLFTGDTLFAEGCGLCRDTESAYAMFASLDFLKRILSPHTRVYPGHSYGQPPGQLFAQLLRDNIYLQFPNKELFAAFRLRKNNYIRNIFGQ